MDRNTHPMQPMGDHTPYRDDPFATPTAPTNPDLVDYYDGDHLPPPHRISGIYSSSSPNASATNLSDSPYAAAATASSFRPPDAAQRGAYAAPPAAAAATAAGTLAPSPAVAAAIDSERRMYSNMETGQSYNGQWMEKSASSSGGSKKRWMLIGGLIGLAGIIAVAVAVGVTVSNKNSSSGKGGSSSSSNSSSSTDLSDPSNFEKDPNLKKSFWALAYTPEGSQLPDCGNNLTSVIQDVQLISQLTTRLRLYGADCNQSALVLEAIKQTKVDLTVYLGNYNVPNDNHAAYERQRDTIKDAIETYGTDHISGITVGNEFMLNYLTANGASEPNSAVGDTGAAILIQDIQDTRSMLSGMNLDKTLQVGTADAGSYFNTKVLEQVDYGMSNVHPWFAQVTIDQAAGWTADFFNQQNVEPASQLSNKPTMWIAETGWPTQSSNVSTETNGASAASEANLQIFLDTFVCQANTNNTGYFFFELFDEKWKDIQFGGVEGWWGLFHANRTLKRITLPDCVISS